MTISPFEIYLVLQLDKISDLLETLTFFGCIGAVVHTVMVVIARAHDNDMDFLPTRAWVILAVLLTAAGLTPSSKTAAAMIILPPLVNEGLPAIGDEARELYELAKQALENAVRPEPETPQR